MSSSFKIQIAALSILVVSSATAGCAGGVDSPNSEAVGKENSGASCRFYLTAETVRNMDQSTVSPALTSSDQGYLEPSSALGANGPIGAWGPLGALGPVGDNSWNASHWVDAVGDWGQWSDSMSHLGGPLSEAGPLGPDGPLGDAYSNTLPALDCPNHGDQFCKHLQAGGVWSVLGPIGPLGALGPLGPLGPIGAHGFTTDDNGRYLSGSSVRRTVTVPYQGSSRSYELVERYTESFAKSMTDNDTSFMVSGEIDSTSESDTYAFTSKAQQLVTVLVVPENGLSDFNLEIEDSSGKSVATSASDGINTLFFGTPVASGNYIDFVQLSLPANTKLKAKVTARTLDGTFNTYRLIVTGSTGFIDTTDISGDFQVSCSAASQ